MTQASAGRSGGGRIDALTGGQVVSSASGQGALRLRARRARHRLDVRHVAVQQRRPDLGVNRTGHPRGHTRPGGEGRSRAVRRYSRRSLVAARAVQVQHVFQHFETGLAGQPEGNQEVVRRWAVVPLRPPADMDRPHTI